MLISRIPFEGIPQTPFFGTLSGHMLQKSFLFGDFRDPFGSLPGTFGRLLVTKVPQRFQKVSQKRPNGSKALQKGFEKTTWLAFLKKFDVFSTISSFSLVLASIWLLFGSYCLLLAPLGSYCLLFAPIASYCLLLPPRCSYCLLLAPNGSSWLLMAPIAHLVSCWLLLVPIRSYWLLLALYFSKAKKTRFPFIC